MDGAVPAVRAGSGHGRLVLDGLSQERPLGSPRFWPLPLDLHFLPPRGRQPAQLYYYLRLYGLYSPAALSAFVFSCFGAVGRQFGWPAPPLSLGKPDPLRNPPGFNLVSIFFEGPSNLFTRGRRFAPSLACTSVRSSRPAPCSPDPLWVSPDLRNTSSVGG